MNYNLVIYCSGLCLLYIYIYSTQSHSWELIPRTVCRKPRGSPVHFNAESKTDEACISHRIHVCHIYGNIYHQFTPNVSIYTSTMDPMVFLVFLEHVTDSELETSRNTYRKAAFFRCTDHATTSRDPRAILTVSVKAKHSR